MAEMMKDDAASNVNVFEPVRATASLWVLPPCALQLRAADDAHPTPPPRTPLPWVPFLRHATCIHRAFVWTHFPPRERGRALG